MAKLDINGYNATFRTFVDFAQKTHKDGYDSASAKATLAGKRITVSALSLHETSALLRKSSESAANDATREMFRRAVIDMFGGVAKVPESVKKAMELNDYGHGRPLTARRIMAVKNAIDAEGSMCAKGAAQPHGQAALDAAVEKDAQTIKSKLANVRGDQAEELGNAVDLVIRESRHDPELMRILTMNNCAASRSVILDSVANKVRPDDEILRRLEALKGNLDELRAATGSNLRLFDLLSVKLGRMGGKTFPKGVIPRIFEAVRALDLKPLRNISASSSPVKIAEAMCGFAKSLAKVQSETHALESLNDASADVILPYNDLVLAIICDSCGEKALFGLREAMGSRNYGKAVAAFDNLWDEKLPPGVDPRLEETQLIMRTGRVLCDAGFTRTGILAAVNESLGTPIEDEFPRGLAITPAEYRSVYNVVERHVQQAAAEGITL